MECTVMILWCSLIMGMILVLLRTFVHSTDKRLDNLNGSHYQGQPFMDSDKSRLLNISAQNYSRTDNQTP